MLIPFFFEWEVSFLAQRDEKKDVSLTYNTKMPKLNSKAVKASFQRRGGSAHFISSSKNLASDTDLSFDGQNEFVLNWIGDDELCETSADDNIGVDLVNDLIDGDAEDSRPPQTPTPLLLLLQSGFEPTTTYNSPSI